MDQMLYELQAHGDVELMPTHVIMNASDSEVLGNICNVAEEIHNHHYKEVWMIHLSNYYP